MVRSTESAQEPQGNSCAEGEDHLEGVWRKFDQLVDFSMDVSRHEGNQLGRMNGLFHIADHHSRLGTKDLWNSTTSGSSIRTGKWTCCPKPSRTLSKDGMIVVTSILCYGPYMRPSMSSSGLEVPAVFLLASFKSCRTNPLLPKYTPKRPSANQPLPSKSPFTLRYLISFATKAYYAQRAHAPGPDIGHGVGLVIGITLMQMLQSLATNHFIYRGQMVGAQARAVLITTIFEKAMKISGRAKAGGRAVENETIQADESEKISAPVINHGFFMKTFVKKSLPKTTSSPAGVAGVLGDDGGWGNGRMVNLMSTDTYRVDQASAMFHLIWTSPVTVLISLVLLIVNLSYSALAGFAILVIGSPVLYQTIKKLFARRRAISKITDQRVSLTQEILQAVRFVKYFGWESSFLERIGNIREREIRAIQILLAMRNAINSVSMSLPIFASMLSFITYSLSKHPLNPAPIFSSLALFNTLRLPLLLLPQILGEAIDAWASIGRIQDFLLVEEQNDDFVWDMNGKNAFSMDHADFTWERTANHPSDQDRASDKKHPKQSKALEKRAGPVTKPSDSENGTDSLSTLAPAEPFKLHDINFSVGRNELIAVIGEVGSGKSSLLAALAGDMRRTSGEITMGATRAFCPQYSWIQNATVKDNLLFGKEYNRKWYEKVIDACALRPDIEMLPNRDETEIGERGITISGGQKQRLNIARAIYFNSDIVLMDDPLSGQQLNIFLLLISRQFKAELICCNSRRRSCRTSHI